MRKLYYDEGYSILYVAEHLNVSIDAVAYFMRHHKLKRRIFSEEQNIWSKTTRIPESSFSKPYVRIDSNEKSKKMKYGVVH